jgi:hypothetical protein
VDRFDDVVPNWLTASYLYDVGTLRVRQSEAVFWIWPSFDGWDSIEYLASTMDRMAGRTIGLAGRRAPDGPRRAVASGSAEYGPIGVDSSGAMPASPLHAEPKTPCRARS